MAKRNQQNGKRKSSSQNRKHDSSSKVSQSPGWLEVSGAKKNRGRSGSGGNFQSQPRSVQKTYWRQ